MKQSIFLIMFLMGLLNVGHNFAQTSKRPNILVIFSDDHTNQSISAYGSKLMQTPNIDKIAKQGAIFKNTFVTNSICAPSRAVLLTGKYSHINGLIDNRPNRNFDGSQVQVQKLLGQANYQTAWIGKWHLQSLPVGFDYWKVLPDQGNYFQPDFVEMTKDTVRYNGYVTNLISDFSLGWLDKRDTTKPFFLVVGEKATHRNWMPAVEDLGAYDAQQFPMPDNFFDTYEGRTAALEQDMTVNKTMTIGDDLKMNINYDKPGMFGRLTPAEKLAYKNYYGKIALEYEKVKSDSIALIKWKYQRYLKDYLATAKSLDRNIGRILAYLEKSGLAENTVVMYASDQGFYMGEHGWFDKRFMYEESLKTPLVLKYPKHIKPGTVVNDIVVNIDFAPTFLDIAGVKAPVEMQGKSFLPIVIKSGKVENWRTAMFYHYYEYPQPHKVPPHFGIRTMRYKLIRFYGPRNEWELYDLKTDPTEMHNIIHDQKQANTILDLKKQLRSLIVEYKDTEALQILNSN